MQRLELVVCHGRRADEMPVLAVVDPSELGLDSVAEQIAWRRRNESCGIHPLCLAEADHYLGGTDVASLCVVCVRAPNERLLHVLQETERDRTLGNPLQG